MRAASRKCVRASRGAAAKCRGSVAAAVKTHAFFRSKTRSTLLISMLLAACEGSEGGAPPVIDATVADANDATADRADSAATDAPVDHVEPAPGTPGGTCSDGGSCPSTTQCNGARCERCGGLGERPCASGCREGSLRWGVCFSDSAPSGTLGGLCHLEDCTPGTCTVPDGRAFVCFACGETAGQPCCPLVGCTGPGLHCDDGVCH